MTPQEYFEKLNSKLTASTASSINAVYQFDVKGDNGGTWVVDLTKDSDWVSAGPSDSAQCTIAVADTDLIDLVEGRLNGMAAFMQGKLKVTGNMGLAMKLQQVLA